MEGIEFELFLHGIGRPQVVTARLDETLREVLARHDALPADGQFVFVGEAEEALNDPEAESDIHEPVSIELTLEVLELNKHRHVHTRAPHRIEVTVYFNGHHKRFFSPATTIATVTAWAKKRFHVDPAAGADLLLELRPSGAPLRPDEHLGELLPAGLHTLEFNLVREVTPQGWLP